MDGDLLSDDEKASFLFTPLHYENKFQVNQVLRAESDKKPELVKGGDVKVPEIFHSSESSLVELNQVENADTETLDIVLEKVSLHQKQQEQQQQQQQDHEQEFQLHLKLSKRLRSRGSQPRDYETESESFKFITSIAVEDESEKDIEKNNNNDNNVPLPDDDNFESEPSIDDYVTLTTKLCDIEEVYLLNVGGLRSSIPRRKIGSWINVSRYKMFLNKVDIKKLENDLLLCRKKVLLDDAKLPLAYQGYWTPLPTARMFARKYEIYSNVRPLLIFNRIARTIYCGFEFFEMFVHINANTSIRVLRRCDNDYLNLNQLFDVYDAVKGPQTRKNLRRLFLNEYTSKNMPLIKYGDATLCGGNWVPLLQAREFCDYYELTSYVTPILAFAKSPSEGLQKVSRLEYALLNNWKIIDSNFVSTNYQLNTLKRFHGFPMNFKIPKHHKVEYKPLKKLIREEHTKRKKLAKLVHHYNNYYMPEYHNQDFKITKTSLKSEIFGIVKNLMEMKKEYLNRLGRVIHIRLKESKRKVFTDYYVFRRYSDGKVNLSSLLSAVVALRLNKLSRSDKDPDMQIENELYYRDTLNLVETDEVYMNFSDSFLNYLNQPMFQEQELENSRDLVDSLSLKNEVLTVLKTCVNGKWGDINVARDIFKEFHFNVDDNAQHYKLNEILYSSQFVDLGNLSDDDDGTAHNSDLDGPDSDLEIIDEAQKEELGILFKRSTFDGVSSDELDDKGDTASQRIPPTEVSNYDPKSAPIPIVPVSDESDIISDSDENNDGKGYIKFKQNITKPNQQQANQQRQKLSPDSVDSNSNDYEGAQLDKVPVISLSSADFTPEPTELLLHNTTSITAVASNAANTGTKFGEQGSITTSMESITLNGNSPNGTERNFLQDTSTELSNYDSEEQVNKSAYGSRMGKEVVEDLIHGYEENKAHTVGLDDKFSKEDVGLVTMPNNRMRLNQKFYLNREVDSEIVSDRVGEIVGDNERVGYGRIEKENYVIKDVEKRFNSNGNGESEDAKQADYLEIVDSEASDSGENYDNEQGARGDEKHIQQAVTNESHYEDVPVARKQDTKQVFGVDEERNIDSNRINIFFDQLNDDDYNGGEYQQTSTAVSGEDSLSENEYFNDNGMNDNDTSYVDGTGHGDIEDTETTTVNSADPFVESRPHDMTMPYEDDDVVENDINEDGLEVVKGGDIIKQKAGNFANHQANEHHFSIVRTTNIDLRRAVRLSEVENQNEAATGPVSQIAVEDYRHENASCNVPHSGARINFYEKNLGEESRDTNLANDKNSSEEVKSDIRVREEEVLDNKNHIENNLITHEVNFSEHKLIESLDNKPTIADPSTFYILEDIDRKSVKNTFVKNEFAKDKTETKKHAEAKFAEHYEPAGGKLEGKQNSGNELSEFIHNDGINDETINFELDTSSEDEEFQTKIMEEIDRMEKERQKMFAQIAIERSDQQRKLKRQNEVLEDSIELLNTSINNFQSANAMRHRGYQEEAIQPVSQKRNLNMNCANESSNDDFSLVEEVISGEIARRLTVKSARNGHNVRKLIIKYVDEHGVHRSRHISTTFNRKNIHSTTSFEFTEKGLLSINSSPNFYHKPREVENTSQLSPSINDIGNSIDDNSDVEIINLSDEEEMLIAERHLRHSKTAYRSARLLQPLAVGRSSKKLVTLLASNLENPTLRRTSAAVPKSSRKKRIGAAYVSSGSKSRKRSHKKTGTLSTKKRPKVEGVGPTGGSIGGSSGSVGLGTGVVSKSSRANVSKSALLEDSDSDFEFAGEIIPLRTSQAPKSGRNISKSGFKENKVGSINDYAADTENITDIVMGNNLVNSNGATNNINGLNGNTDDKDENNAEYDATSDLNNGSEDDAVLLGVNILNNENDKRKTITTTLAKRRQKLVQKRLKKRTNSNRIENSGAQLPDSYGTNINNGSKAFVPVDSTSGPFTESNDEGDVDEDGGEIIKLGNIRRLAFAKASRMPQLSIIGEKIVSLLTNNIITQDNDENINQVKHSNKGFSMQPQSDFVLSNNSFHGLNYYEYMLSNNIVPIITISSDLNQKASDVNYEVTLRDKSVTTLVFSNKGNEGFSSGAETSAQTVMDSNRQQLLLLRTLAEQIRLNEDNNFPTMIVVLRFNNLSRYKLVND